MIYEVIYEDGSYSVANYDSDEEAIAALAIHHERAKEGGPALASAPEIARATRIVKLIRYETDPGSFLESQAVSDDVAKKEVAEALKASTESGVTDLRALAARIRDISNPLLDTGPHESNYKAEGEEVKLPFTEG